jgi:hypothetical protein
MEMLRFESKEVAPGQLYLKAAGPINADNLSQLKTWTEQTAELIASVHNKSGNPISCVFDISGLTEASDARAVAILTEFQKANSPHIRRTGLVVSNSKVGSMLHMSAMLASRTNITQFPSAAEAEAWAFAAD